MTRGFRSSAASLSIGVEDKNHDFADALIRVIGWWRTHHFPHWSEIATRRHFIGIASLERGVADQGCQPQAVIDRDSQFYSGATPR